MAATCLLGFVVYHSVHCLDTRIASCRPLHPSMTLFD